MNRVGQAWQLEIDGIGRIEHAVYAVIEDHEEGCYGILIETPRSCEYLIGTRVLLPHDWFLREEDVTRLA